MFNDWIKMRVDLYNDPKVILIADKLLAPTSPLAEYVNQVCQCDMIVTHNVTRNATVGALVTVWGIARHQGDRRDNDLVLKNCKITMVDEICHIQGFGEAMVAAGWLKVSQDGSRLVFPRFFEEKNVDPLDARRQKDALRQKRQRQRNKSRGDSRDVVRDGNVRIQTEREIEIEIENNSNITLNSKDGATLGAAVAVVDKKEGEEELLLSEVVAALTKCSMDPQVIPKLTANHPLEKIMQAIEMVRSRGNSVRNVAGLVRAALDGNWESDVDDADARFEEERKVDIARSEAERAEKRAQHKKQFAEHQKHLEILAALPPGQFDKLKQAAHEAMSPGMAKKVDLDDDPMDHGLWPTLMWVEYEKAHAASESGDLLAGTQ